MDAPALCRGVDGEVLALNLLCRSIAFVLSRMLRQLRKRQRALLARRVVVTGEVSQR